MQQVLTITLITSGVLLASVRVILLRSVDRRKRACRDEVHRRASQEQGRALETLGHALEYLVDCDLYDGRTGN